MFSRLSFPFIIWCLITLPGQALAQDFNLDDADPDVTTTLTLEQIQQVVEAVQEGLKRQPHDLIGRREVALTLAALAKAGWRPETTSDLVDNSLPDEHYLLQKFSTKKGVEFMRAIGRRKGIYPQLDLLQRTPNGRNLIEKMVQGPDGYKLIDFIAKKNKGNLLADFMPSRDPKTVRLLVKEVSQRIYTFDQLTERLGKDFAQQFGDES